MTRSQSTTGFVGWLNHVAANSPLLSRLNIHRRLTLCFIFVIVLMMLGDGVVLWQLHLIRAQVERLNGVDEELIEVLRVHAGLLSVYERLGTAARSKDAARLLKESETLRNALQNETQRTQAAFNHLPPEVKLNPTVQPNLESIQRTLPSHLEAIKELAASGEWEAVRARLDGQLKPLESLSSQLVSSIDQEVSEERARALLNIEHAQRRIFVIVPLTAAFTLFIAALFGTAITLSITESLKRLLEASKALARGEFQHQVSVTGQDELAQVGQVFNLAAERLQTLYETLRRRETYLAEAQRLSHTGSWAWNVATKQLFWSEENFRIFGLDPNTTPTSEIFRQRVHPDDRATLEPAEAALFAGYDAEYNFRIVLPDNSIKYIRSVAHPVTDASGQVIEFVGTAIDVTEQKTSSAELEKAFAEIKYLKDRIHDENVALREQIDQALMFEEIVGSSPALQVVLSRIVKVAPTDSTVLIIGETGTGKELIARAVHKRSQRSGHAFISVNCASIPSTLIASELFGHEKGAFTGAFQRHQGRFELAHSGTIFLDEIGELPPDMQIALLRVLQECQFEPMGSNRTLLTNVRVIAATNRDLPAAVTTGTFRADLFYRLNVFPIEVPPLRERKEDIPLLVEYFVKRYAEKVGKHIRKIDKNTLEQCQAYPWPGNIRELQNIIERSVILCTGDTFWVDQAWLTNPAPRRSDAAGPLAEKIQNQERELIEAALALSKGRVAGPGGAAAKLGIPRSTLDWKIQQLRIQKNRFKSES